jgi:hypothetical protein
MRTPVMAMLWELWRVTRLETAFRMLLTVSLGATLRFVTPEHDRDLVAMVALLLAVLLAAPFWLSIAGPGFPFHLGFVRPVRTWMLVGVPMAYLAGVAAASYLVPVIVLGAVFDYTFPLLPVAAWIAALIFAQAATNWWTRSKVIQILGGMGAVGGGMVLAINRLHGEAIRGNGFLPSRWPIPFAFSPTDYGIIASIAAAAVGLAIVCVTRQRHGGVLVNAARAGRTDFATVLIDAFRFKCPTATAVRAQLWFEMKSAGGPALTIGGGLALAIPVLLAIVDPLEPVRFLAVLFAMLSPLMVLGLGTNAFGLHRTQSDTYASTFDTGQAVDTAGLAALKILARTASLSAALAAVGVSLWMSAPLVSEWTQVPWTFYGNLAQGQRAVAVAADALAGHQIVALTVVAITGLTAAIAYFASIQALSLVHPWRTMVVVSGVSLFSLASLLAAPPGVGGDGLEVRLVAAYPWIATVTIPLGTLYVFREALTERLLTARQALGAVFLWAGLLATWLTVLQVFGLRLAEMSPALIALMLSLSLLPLAAVALAPWSLSLVRHR